MPSVLETRKAYDNLQAGDRIELTHEVKVGLKRWYTTTQGTVVKTHRQRHGLHWRRNPDDKVYRDEIVLQLPDGSITTLTIDEWTELKVLPQPSGEGTSSPAGGRSEAPGQQSPGQQSPGQQAPAQQAPAQQAPAQQASPSPAASAASSPSAKAAGSEATQSPAAEPGPRTTMSVGSRRRMRRSRTKARMIQGRSRTGRNRISRDRVATSRMRLRGVS